MFLSVNTWTVVELAEVLDVDMKDGLIGQKAVAQLWLKLCKAKRSHTLVAHRLAAGLGLNSA
jgi:hypothetical protein